MNYTLEKLEKSQVKFTIEINEAEVEAAIQEAYNKNKSHYKLEGFRPGKVPRKVLEAEFGKDVAAEVRFKDAEGAGAGKAAGKDQGSFGIGGLPQCGRCDAGNVCAGGQ